MIGRRPFRRGDSQPEEVSTLAGEARSAQPRLLPRDGARVELSAVTKRYGDALALDQVSLSLEPGRFLVLLGPSGSGKSTLIRCLAGIERPTSGSISLDGQIVADARRHVPPEQRDLAMVFQDFALWPHMSAHENVRFALRRRRLSRPESSTRALAMLERVGLARKRERYPHELSGGEQQRVALARALVGGPRLLLFDEPLSSLDASLRERLRVEIGTLVRESGASAVYITHDQSEAFALGDEVGVLEAGRLVQCDTPEAIYRTPAAPFVARFTGLAGTFGGRLLGPAARSGEAAATRRVRVALPSSLPGRHLELEGTAAGDLPAGKAVQVLVRPTGVRICEDDRCATLRCLVRDVAFCGRGYEYVLEIGRGLELTSVFDGRRLERGHSCGVVLDPQQCLVYAQDATSPDLPPLPIDSLPSSNREGATLRSREPSAARSVG
ncbi:MAG: ABC transporter ATP-binding protein [Solirubrobacteraceae bacterium]